MKITKQMIKLTKKYNGNNITTNFGESNNIRRDGLN